MKRYRAMILLVATAASVAIGLTSFISPADAQPRVQPGGAVTYTNAVPGLAPPDIGVAPSATDGTMVAASSCQPISLPDNPHYSAPDVSGHGQWEKGNCTSNQADVYNCLYEYYTDGTWRRKACSPKVRIYPKSISNNRSTARRRCDSTGQLISWRNHVDVDVVGQNDPPDTPYRQADVLCVVTGPDQ